MRTVTNIAAWLVLAVLISCKQSFEPIDYGKDACAHCKMTIVDKRYAAELLTGKGRVYKFDDIHCLKQYLDEQGSAVDAAARIFVAPYGGNRPNFLDATKAVFLQSDFFGSPMNGHYAAFASQTDAKHLSDSLTINAFEWDKVK